MAPSPWPVSTTGLLLPSPWALGLAGAAGLGTAGDGDLGALLEHGVVLPGGRGGHEERGAAEAALGLPGQIGGQGRMRTLGQLQLEARDRSIGDRPERGG